MKNLEISRIMRTSLNRERRSEDRLPDQEEEEEEEAVVMEEEAAVAEKDVEWWEAWSFSVGEFAMEDSFSDDLVSLTR